MTRSTHFFMASALALLTLNILLGCFSGGGGVGEECSGSCDDDLVCSAAGNGEGICTERCTAISELCEDGSLCAPLDSGGGVCQIEELAGTTGIGERCRGSNDCTKGAICVGVDETRCWQVCDPDVAGSSCARDETCYAFGEDSDATRICQKSLQTFCNDGETCQEGYQCGLEDEDNASIEEVVAFGGSCNIQDCTTDADCPGDAVCRTSGVVYSETNAALQANPEVTRTYCHSVCSDQTGCSLLDFSSLVTCITPKTCDGLTQGKEECMSFLGSEAGVCLKGL